MASEKDVPIIKMRNGGLLINPYIISFFALILPAMSINAIQGQNAANDEIAFDKNYNITWGNNHINFLDNRKEAHLTMDNISGGAGFESKLRYASGFFPIKMKLPERNSTGVVTTFYLCSVDDNDHGVHPHDEVDFEFLGSGGPNYSLQTNIYADDNGGREQKIHLWFDPTKDLHTYSILWSQHIIVFYVDKIPIRVYKNYTNMGARFPTKLMQVRGSIWDGSEWATNHYSGANINRPKTSSFAVNSASKIDWSQSPFVADYRGFDVEACSAQNPKTTSDCYDYSFWWNSDKFWDLDPQKRRQYEDVKKKYLVYDYCSHRSNWNIYPECKTHQLP